MNLTSPQRRLLIESDIDKRRLERASVHGDEEAKSKELVQKMRSGDLTQGQVKLLSYLSYKPAQSLIPVEPPPSDLKKFVKGLEPWGREVLVKAAIISASSVLHIWENEYPDDNRPREAIEAASRSSGAAGAAAYPGYAAAAYAASHTSANTNTAKIVWTAMAAGSVAYAASHTSSAAWAADAAHITSKVDPSLNVRGIIEKELIGWVLNA